MKIFLNKYRTSPEKHKKEIMNAKMKSNEKRTFGT